MILKTFKDIALGGLILFLVLILWGVSFKELDDLIFKLVFEPFMDSSKRFQTHLSYWQFYSYLEKSVVTTIYLFAGLFMCALLPLARIGSVIFIYTFGFIGFVGWDHISKHNHSESYYAVTLLLWLILISAFWFVLNKLRFKKSTSHG